MQGAAVADHGIGNRQHLRQIHRHRRAVDMRRARQALAGNAIVDTQHGAILQTRQCTQQAFGMRIVTTQVDEHLLAGGHLRPRRRRARHRLLTQIHAVGARSEWIEFGQATQHLSCCGKALVQVRHCRQIGSGACTVQMIEQLTGAFADRRGVDPFPITKQRPRARIGRMKIAVVIQTWQLAVAGRNRHRCGIGNQQVRLQQIEPGSPR